MILTEKEDFLLKTQHWIESQGFTVISSDFSRPWGGFLVLDEKEIQNFISTFFSNIPPSAIIDYEKLSPKILIVQPEKRLSWQYHHRRSEIWRVIEGKVGVVKSNSDTENPMFTLQMGEFVILNPHERHRLVGLDSWGVVAEIWQHTDTSYMSDEEDIVRLTDDFGR